MRTGPLTTMLTTHGEPLKGVSSLLRKPNFGTAHSQGPVASRGAWNCPSPGCMYVFPLLYFVAWLTCSCRSVMRLSTGGLQRAVGTAQFVTSSARASKSCASVLLKYLVFMWWHRKRHFTLGDLHILQHGDI